MTANAMSNLLEEAVGDRREATLSFLRDRNAGEVRHSGANLLKHLTGVEAILARWGVAEAVQLGGLLHSVYGTEGFRRAIHSPRERDALREAAGPEPERLAWLFGGMRGGSLLKAIQDGGANAIATRWSDEPEPLGAEELSALAHIFAANWLEQFDRLRPMNRATRMGDIRLLADWLGGEAKADLVRAYGFDTPPLAVERGVRPEDGDRGLIEVWDSAVPAELRVRLAGLMDQNIWRYGWKASHEQTAYGFWHCHFAGDDELTFADCEHELMDRPLVAPVLELWRMLQAGPLKGQVLVRAYANGHTFGGDGHLHRDHTGPGHHTTIYYAHADWKPNWAGETVFFDEAQEQVMAAVFPLPGRIVHFPGRLLHAARSPGRECPALRSVVVLKSRTADAP